MSAPLPTMPSFRLDGRRALVTGAGRGIGLAAAVALAEAGADVVLAARTTREIDEASAAIRARGHKAFSLTMDVTAIEATQKAIAATGPFDILVNNAGTAKNRPAVETTPEAYDSVADMNIKGAYFVAQAVAKGLLAAGKPGSLIHITSQMGHVGGPNRSVYCATKWAVEGFSKAMAIEFGPAGIRSNCIAPTFIETSLTKAGLAQPEFRAWVLSKIKLGRIGRIEDLMGPVVFLASDASSLMTGTSLLVDGGWTAE